MNTKKKLMGGGVLTLIVSIMLLLLGVMMVSATIHKSSPVADGTVFADEIPLLNGGTYNSARWSTSDLTLQYSLSTTNHTASVRKKNAPSGAVTIPSAVEYGGEEYSVTSVASGGFQDCTGLTSITIPSSVTSIGNYAFRGCSGLTSMAVDAGNSVYDSRNDCNAIIQTSTNTLVAGCKNTIIPNSVTSIGSYAFYGSGLIYIEIPETVSRIDGGAFSMCHSLKTVVIGCGWEESVGVWDDESDGIFYGCENLQEIYAGSYAQDIEIYGDYNEQNGSYTATAFYAVTINANGTYSLDTFPQMYYCQCEHFVRASSLGADNSNLFILKCESEVKLAVNYDNYWARKGSSTDDAKVAYKVCLKDSCFGPLPCSDDGETGIVWFYNGDRLTPSTVIDDDIEPNAKAQESDPSNNVYLINGTIQVFPDTGVKVEFMLPSLTIGAVIVAIPIVAVSNKKRKVVVKK